MTRKKRDAYLGWIDVIYLMSHWPVINPTLAEAGGQLFGRRCGAGGEPSSHPLRVVDTDRI